MTPGAEWNELLVRLWHRSQGADRDLLLHHLGVLVRHLPARDALTAKQVLDEHSRLLKRLSQEFCDRESVLLVAWWFRLLELERTVS